MNNARKKFDEGVMPLFENARAAYLVHAREVAVELAKAHPQRLCTVDEVREQCPPPEGFDPRVMGAIFKCGGKRPVWRKAGMKSSHRGHGRAIVQFQLRELDGDGNPLPEPKQDVAVLSLMVFNPFSDNLVTRDGRPCRIHRIEEHYARGLIGSRESSWHHRSGDGYHTFIQYPDGAGPLDIITDRDG